MSFVQRAICCWARCVILGLVVEIVGAGMPLFIWVGVMFCGDVAVCIVLAVLASFVDLWS